MSRPKVNPVGNPRSAAAPTSDVLPAVQGAPVVEVPDPPEHLGLDEIGLDMWAKIWTDGGSAYRTTDEVIIGQYTVTYQRWILLLKLVEKEGVTTVGSTGQTVIHPAAKQLDSIETKLISLSNVLGLNPESRIRLGIANTDLSAKLDAALSQFE